MNISRLKAIVQFLCISSTPCWIVLGFLLVSLPFFVSQSDVSEFYKAYTLHKWLHTPNFMPSWFALPQWILFFWFICNFVLFFVNKILKRFDVKLRMPLLSFPFIVLLIFVTIQNVAHNSDYFKVLYAPNESYIRNPSKLKSLRAANTDTTNPYEIMAAEKPKRIRNTGKLWEVPEIILEQFTPLSYIFSGGQYDKMAINYRLRIPKNIKPDKRYPLLIWLHGIGERGNDNVAQLSHMEPLIPFIVGQNQRDFFILAVQCPVEKTYWDTSSNKTNKNDSPITITMEVLGDVIRNYPVDEDAISVYGLSSGGYGVWTMGEQHGGRFAALVPISCNPPTNAYKFVSDYGTTVWTFNNAGDGGFVYSRVEEEVKRINDKGGTAYMTTFDSGGHEAWRTALLETPLIDWLLYQRLNPSPTRPPYGVQPIRNDSEYWRLSILPIYLSLGCFAIVIVHMVRTRKNLMKSYLERISNYRLLVGIMLTIQQIPFGKPLRKQIKEKLYPIKKTNTENNEAEEKKTKQDNNDEESIIITDQSFREWTNTSGKKLELKLIAIKGDIARFELRDGRKAKTKIEVFCQEDQEILKQCVVQKASSN